MVDRLEPNRSEGRIIFAAVAVFLTFVGNEFTSEGLTLWYQTRVFGVPLQYPILALLIGLIWPMLRERPQMSVTSLLQESRIWPWVVLGWVTLIVALILALVRQAENPFVDWRNWLVIAVAAVVVAKLLVDRSWSHRALTDLAIGYGVLSAIHISIWIGGGGTQLFDVRIPLFDGDDLALAVLAAAVSAEAWVRGFPHMSRAYSIALRLTLLFSAALVMLSFRRTLWAFMVLGLIGVGLWAWRTSRSRRLSAIKILVLFAAVTAFAVVSLGPETVSERLESFNLGAQNAYAATNEDHVNDLFDAFAVVANEPLLGLGIGETYETDLIAEWKEESFEVHNAFLNSWLKFGLLGLVTYIGLHIAIGRAFLKLGGLGVVGFTAAGLLIFMEQVVGLVQTWPYNGFGSSLARGVLIGVFLACLNQQPKSDQGELLGTTRSHRRASPAAPIS